MKKAHTDAKYYFLVAATPLLMSPIYDFLWMSGVEPGDLPITSKRATNLANHPSKDIIIFKIYIY